MNSLIGEYDIMKTNAGPNRGPQRISVPLDDRTLVKLKRLAADYDVSVAKTAKWLIEQAVEKAGGTNSAG